MSVGAIAVLLAVVAPQYAGAEEIAFSRDVLPILSENCFACHGPDENTRERGLRFDTREGLLEGSTRTGPVIAPGNPDGSVLLQRILDPDPGRRMPPAETHLTVSPEEVATLRAWITEGAAWSGHWSFTPPVKPELPQVSDPDWCRNPIDRFILQGLDEAGLAPSPEAPRDVLIRRVSLDLTGLPPTPAEVEAFLADTGDDAYEKVVDRLLASPHFGERMAFPWLDAARYADTNGYQRDTKRDMWHWRDWVIRAFNDNMPYDQFTIEQLAGDLLPDATLSQKIATGFNRNHRINGEGGIIPEEYAVEYVVDRVDTTSTTWMGLTMGCARCHDHKFDPVSQKEFFELYAFFNQVPEEGKGRERGNDKPFVAVPTPEQEEKRAALEGQIAALEKELFAPDERLDALQRDWEDDMATHFAQLEWRDPGSLTLSTHNGAELSQGEDGVIIATGPNPDREVYEIAFEAEGTLRAFKLDIFTHESLPETGPGRSPNGNVVVSEFEVARIPAGTEGAPEPVPVTSALADYAQERDDFQVTFAIDGNDDTGWATGSLTRRENRTAIFTLGDGAAIAPGDRVVVRVKHNSGYTQHSIGRFALAVSESGAAAQWGRPEFGPWHHVGPFPMENPDNSKLLDTVLAPEEGFDPARAYGDGTFRWQEKPEWTDGVVHQFEPGFQSANYLHRTLRLHAPGLLTLSLGSNDGIKVWINGEVKHHNNVGRTSAPDQDRLEVFLPQGDHEIMMKIVNHGGGCAFYFRPVDDHGRSLMALMKEIATPRDGRSEEAQQALRNRYRGLDPQWVARNGEVTATRQARADLEKSIITTMVMEDMKEPRDTFLLNRGLYDQPDTSERLFPSVPAFLGAMDESLPKNRLGFAQWLMEPEHPLTARVRVNHFWQLYFGRGLVRTSEDFGTQGTWPSHPELLDWLALHFIETGWDVKAIQKIIVTSAAYRQHSAVTEDHQEKDPENILLARAPRLRLPAEMLRDQALQVSGLLHAELGGPSVKPYQPEGLWTAFTFQNNDEYDTNYYTEDTGPGLYRRGLYTYWKRTIAPPRMQIFNAAGREQCSIYQEATNTPMQALVLLNDPTFIEAARHLAGRMVREGGPRAADRIRYGYRLALAQEPDLVRQQILLGGLSDYQAHYNSRIEDARALLAVGTSETDAAVAESELAAYTLLASVLLNLDEIITRE